MFVHKSIPFNLLTRFVNTFYFHHLCLLHLATSHQRLVSAAMALLTSHFPTKPRHANHRLNESTSTLEGMTFHLTHLAELHRIVNFISPSHQGSQVHGGVGANLGLRYTNENRALFVMLLEDDLGRNHNKSQIHIQV